MVSSSTTSGSTITAYYGSTKIVSHDSSWSVHRFIIDCCIFFLLFIISSASTSSPESTSSSFPFVINAVDAAFTTSFPSSTSSPPKTLTVNNKNNHNRERNNYHRQSSYPPQHDPSPAPTSLFRSSSVRRLSSADSSSGIRGGSSSGLAEQKEYKSEASNLFGNIRVPAALFAGASAGAAFAMPIGSGTFKVELSKRVYALLMMSSLTFEIIAVVVSTLVVASMSTTTSFPKTSSLEDLLDQHYQFEWVTTRFHFLSGVLLFILGIGIRAWVSISCPIIARAALGTVLTGTLMCVAFVEDSSTTSLYTEGDDSRNSSLMNGVLALPWNYLKLLFDKAKTRPLFAIAMAMGLATSAYTVAKIPHIISWLNQ